MKRLLYLGLLIGCGAEQLPVEQPSDEQANEPTEGFSLIVDEETNLPECTDITRKILVYVKKTENFRSCETDGWAKVELKGKDGKDGKNGVDGANGTAGVRGSDGADGVDGVAGDKGDKGDPGTDGTNGATGPKGDQGDKGDKGDTGQSGVNGANGVDGTNGVDGQNAKRLVLHDSSGEIGEIFWIDSSSGDYWVVDDDGHRFEIDRVDGTFPNGYFFFSGTDCSGEMRMGYVNGEFKSVAKQHLTGEFYAKTGQSLGSFDYQSRMAGSTNCQNHTSSINDSWTTEAYTLPFTYPLTNLYFDMEQ